VKLIYGVEAFSPNESLLLPYLSACLIQLWQLKKPLRSESFSGGDLHRLLFVSRRRFQLAAPSKKGPFSRARALNHWPRAASAHSSISLGSPFPLLPPSVCALYVVCAAATTTAAEAMAAGRRGLTQID